MDFGGWWDVAAFAGGGGGRVVFCRFVGEWNGGLKWSMELRDGDIDRWSR